MSQVVQRLSTQSTKCQGKVSSGSLRSNRSIKNELAYCFVKHDEHTKTVEKRISNSLFIHLLENTVFSRTFDQQVYTNSWMYNWSQNNKRRDT